MTSSARIIKPVLKIVVSLAFFSVLLSFVQGNELAGVFSQVNWNYMVITCAVTLFMVAASCAKWKLILDLKQKISFYELFRIYLVGYFFSNILPSTVGGDVVRSYYAGRIIKNQSYSAVAVFVERFSGVFFLFLIVLFAPLFKPQLYSSPYILFPACAGAGCALVTVWIWRAKDPFRIPDRIADSIFNGINRLAGRKNWQTMLRLSGRCRALYDTVLEKMTRVKTELSIATGAIKNDKRFLVRLILLTALFYVCTWVNVYTAFRAFNVHVPMTAVCAIVPAIMLVAHIPVTLLGNLGYFESVFVFYFLLVGVGGAESLAMGLLLRLKLLIMGIIGFFTYLFYKQGNVLNFKETE